MRPNTWLGAFAVYSIMLWAFACTESPEASDAADVSTPAPGRIAAYNGGDGVPGPWWQHGASRKDFDVDLRSCRKRSVEARRAATEDPPDAAYRAFLECMTELAWNWGAPPNPTLIGPG